jgi:2-polyprenyl-6-methoxyphenol hydroxylase-like FAD-dependent oxidoreductase
MLPSAGQGAINAMQDATILANCINDIKRLDRDSISAHLKDYQDQRYQFAKIQFETSKRFAVIMGGQVTKKKQSLSKKNKG